MFSFRRITAFGEFWAQVVKEILGMVGKDIVVEVRKVLHFGSLNNMMKNMFVKSYVFGEG